MKRAVAGVTNNNRFKSVYLLEVIKNVFYRVFPENGSLSCLWTALDRWILDSVDCTLKEPFS